jgi:hypothetical protein
MFAVKWGQGGHEDEDVGKKRKGSLPHTKFMQTKQFP